MTEPQKLNLVTGGDPSADATYDPVSSDQIAYVEIFPPVGITRFGDSEREYFLAPEVPDRTSPPAGIVNFRDSEQHIRRQVPSSIDSISLVDGLFVRRSASVSMRTIVKITS